MEVLKLSAKINGDGHRILDIPTELSPGESVGNGADGGGAGNRVINCGLGLIRVKSVGG